MPTFFALWPWAPDTSVSQYPDLQEQTRQALLQFWRRARDEVAMSSDWTLIVPVSIHRVGKQGMNFWTIVLERHLVVMRIPDRRNLVQSRRVKSRASGSEQIENEADSIQAEGNNACM